MSDFVSKENLEQILAETRNASTANIITYTRDSGTGTVSRDVYTKSGDTYIKSVETLSTVHETLNDSTVSGYPVKYAIPIDNASEYTPIVSLVSTERVKFSSICGTNTETIDGDPVDCLLLYRDSAIGSDPVTPGEIIERIILVK